MDKPVENWWKLRLADLKTELEANNFDVYLADNGAAAQSLVLDTFLPSLAPASIAWGGSMTFVATGLYAELKKRTDIQVIDTFDRTLTAEEMVERRRQSLLVDLFITGTNAVTETGHLVNLDMIGNRVAAITFGPKNVLLFIGRNKLVPDRDAAIARIKNYAAPVNVLRLKKKTPCGKTAHCEDCSSPDRICNTWTITEKCFPRKRIKIVLINEDLGF
jgi:hypothetical protein